MLFAYAANRGTTAGSSGDEIGKALASVSSFGFLSLNVRQKENLMHNSDCGIVQFWFSIFYSVIQNKQAIQNIPKNKTVLKDPYNFI